MSKPPHLPSLLLLPISQTVLAPPSAVTYSQTACLSKGFPTGTSAPTRKHRVRP